MRPTIAILFCAWLALQAGPAWTQEEQKHVVGIPEVWQSVSEEPDVKAAQRAQIVRVLQHPTTREVARSHGLDLKAAQDAARVLDGDELQQISARAAVAESALSGGDAVVITTTTLIIILLVIIILLLI